jgi:amino acid transporter
LGLVPNIAGAFKRALVGRPVRSEGLGDTLLPKRIALPVFASDALSSVAYAPDEILLTLSLAGVAAYTVSPWVGLAVVVVLAVVVGSYRQTVHAYPSGGGDYEVVTENLGRRAGTTVAGSLLVDYVLTVAVSISAGAQYLVVVVPALQGHQAAVATTLVVLLALANLRGVRESGRAFAAVVYLYLGAIGLLAVAGALQHLTGTLAPAPSAAFELVGTDAVDAGLTGLGGAFLVLRAFSSGCAALTGVEAISNGVPTFRPPRSRNAATTLALLAGISATMLMTIVLLAGATGVRFAEDPATQLLDGGTPVGEAYHQEPVIGQIARAVFDDAPLLVGLVSVVTGFILVLAANTAFNGFPVLASVLGRDGFLPRQLRTRGDRLVFSNGIIALALAAIVLVQVFDASVTRLIQLYIVGVFLSFTLSQLGMVRHWGEALRTEALPARRAQMRRSRVINAVGFALTAVVLAVVLATKLTHGAWITLVLIAVCYAAMTAVRRHYDTVRDELVVEDLGAARALPSHVHAVVLVSRLHQATLRAVSYARATRPSSLEALTVAVDPEETARLRADWDAAGIPVPLTVLASPFREVTRPVVEYVRSIRRETPRALVVVYVPQYVVRRWWEQLLHNQSALRLQSRLLFVPGVVLASVPWQLVGAEPPAADDAPAPPDRAGPTERPAASGREET